VPRTQDARSHRWRLRRLAAREVARPADAACCGVVGNGAAGGAPALRAAQHVARMTAARATTRAAAAARAAGSMPRRSPPGAIDRQAQRPATAVVARDAPGMRAPPAGQQRTPQPGLVTPLGSTLRRPSARDGVRALAPQPARARSAGGVDSLRSSGRVWRGVPRLPVKSLVMVVPLRRSLRSCVRRS